MVAVRKLLQIGSRRPSLLQRLLIFYDVRGVFFFRVIMLGCDCELRMQLIGQRSLVHQRVQAIVGSPARSSRGCLWTGVASAIAGCPVILFGKGGPSASMQACEARLPVYPEIAKSRTPRP